MKRLVMWIAVGITSAVLDAAPVGNTAAVELIQKGFFIPCDSWIDFRAGYEGDFVTDGRMKQFDQGFGRVDSYEQTTNSAALTCNLFDRLDMYGVLGSSVTEANWRFEDLLAGTITRIEMKTQSDFLWAVGARTIFYEWRHLALGLGGRYSSSKSHLESLTSNGMAQPVSGAHCEWGEWQVHFDVSYQIHFFTPYVGTKYSHARMDLRDFSTPIAADLTGANSFKNRDPVGFYVGCALSTGKYCMLNIEGRLIDEEAVTVSGDFRF